MSIDGSSPASPRLEEPDENGLPSARFLDSQSTTLESASACPNCGRRFTGNYCPTCGQKADADLTVWDIIGGFFRDLIDAENGLWPTLKGLTIAPGQTLRRYLSGARRQYVNPGRYLLFAILFRGGIYQLMKWTEVAEADAGSDPAIDAIQVAFQTIIPTSTGGYAYMDLSFRGSSWPPLPPTVCLQDPEQGHGGRNRGVRSCTWTHIEHPP